ncbi:DPP IV N-terminal domain-containing protein [Corallococcus sp. bb12-1]|uniref:S9 family peptidase n=1 Tax=Corallococcus sp. bb12-1 TaxID=2996784 RepID=UPI002270B72A|nr:DPP IV N-terminal domain-containing protein [Corallococcus sp. bb12-1]MCY1043041.1 DPP IV N-terminal domain-containing protein [Corallococcus sp. bb12-1]
MPYSLPLLLIVVGLFAPWSATAAEDALQARLDFSDAALNLPNRIRDTLAPPRWLPEGERFVYWSVLEPHRDTWVLVDARRKTQQALLSPESLRSQLAQFLGKPAPLSGFMPFTFTPDAGGIVFSVQGRAFTLGLSDRRVVALEPTDPVALSLLPGNALSPDGKALAVQREAGFAVLDAKGTTRVERTGTEDNAWRVPESAWSPPGRFLAVWREDTRGVHQIPLVDYGTAQEKVTWAPYTKTGTPLMRSELHFVTAETGQVTPVPREATESYEWFAGWRPDGSEALVLQLSRDGKRLDLVAVEPATGKRRRVLREERPESFVGALDFAVEGWSRQVKPLPDNRHFLWMSERDGWRHVYLYDWAGKQVRQITQGPFPVHAVVGVEPKGDALYVMASAERDAPYDRLLYRATLKGGDLKRLSQEPGVHRVVLSPSTRYFVDGHSTREQPRAWDVASTDGRQSFRYAKADVSALAALHYTPPEAFTVKAADGTTPLYGVLYKPWDFDPKKRYPVIDVIYAGPFITAVPWGYVGGGESRIAHSLSRLGFIAMVLDARGTPGRSKAFQDVNYGRVGQTEIPDHVAALKQAGATRPYMDLERVGIHGHSWGGYFALRGMLTAPEFFKAGYAGAPGALTEEAIINEPNMGLLTENPTGYAAGSNEALAGKLQGALKMMHGTSDVNATLSTTMRMAQALVQANKHFDLLLMPGEGHNPSGPAGRYYMDDVRRFFLRELGAPR